jgi:hypothetical protein
MVQIIHKIPTKEISIIPTLLLNVYPQFHPSRALEFRAVVLAKRKALVSPIFSKESLNNECDQKKGTDNLPDEMAKVPFRPMYGISTAQVAARAAGTPTTARIKVF